MSPLQTHNQQSLPPLKNYRMKKKNKIWIKNFYWLCNLLKQIKQRWPSITRAQAMKKDDRVSQVAKRWKKWDQVDWINKGCGQLCKKLCRSLLFVAGDTSTQDLNGLVMMMMVMMTRIVSMMMLFLAGDTSTLSLKISMKTIIDHWSLFSFLQTQLLYNWLFLFQKTVGQCLVWSHLKETRSMLWSGCTTILTR